MHNICMICMMRLEESLLPLMINISLLHMHIRVLKEFATRDDVCLKVCLGRFSSGTMKKLYTRRLGPYRVLKRIETSAYELDIPMDVRIGLVLNAEI